MKQMLIKNGTVYDGAGNPPAKIDVLVTDGLISDTGAALNTPPGAACVDAAGMAVTPGFIDIHRHGEVACLTDAAFGETELAQGITTTVFGNCGLSPVPAGQTPELIKEQCNYIQPVVGNVSAVNNLFKEYPFSTYTKYAEMMSSRQFPLNIAFLAAAGAVKLSVKGFSPKPFCKSEMDAACALIEEAMNAGALGLSYGIMYRPECYSTTDELAAMARAAAKHGGFITAHIRGEGDSLVTSVIEMINVAEKASVPLNISHFKATGIKNWRGSIFRAIDCIEGARARGLKVTADFYPYDGGATTLLSLVPPSVMKETMSETCELLAAKDGEDLLRRELSRAHDKWDNMAQSIGWERIIINSPCNPENMDCRGKNMTEITKSRGLKDEVELLTKLILSEEGRTGIIVLSMATEDIDDIAKLPWTCLISDALYAGGTSPHPRLNGAFPKALRIFAREKKLLSMETMIAKMTGMPAERAGIKNRGVIKKGAIADMLVFDPEKFTDNATYAEPARLATGLEKIIIAGNVVKSKENKHGKFVRRF